MLLGAALRRFSSRWIRVTGLVSATVLVCTATGSYGIAAVAAPYPPTSPPCALSWSPDAAGAPELVGSGYDVNQPVTVTLYPQATTLGSYPANASGAFQAPVDVPQSRRDDQVWVTATSPHRSCSVVPPDGGTPTSPTSPPSPPSTGTTPPTAAPTTPATSSSGTSSAPASGSSSGGPGSVGSGGTGSGNGGPGGGTGTTSTPYPPSGPSTGPSGTGSPVTPTGTAVPTRPPSISPAPNADRATRALGLSLSVIVTIAVLLLLAGGLGVLILTRRAN